MDDCDLLLAGGVFTTELIASSQEVKTAWERFWNSLSEEQARKALDSGMKMPLPEGDNLVEGHLSAEDSNNWKKTNVGKDTGSTFTRNDLLVLKHHADPSIIEGFDKCVISVSPGIHAWAASVGTLEILFYIKYNYEGESPRRPIVTQSSVTNAYVLNDASVPKGQIFPKGFVLPFGLTPVTLTREDPYKPCMFEVRTNQGSPSATLPPAQVVPQPEREIIRTVSEATGSRNVIVGGIPQWGSDTMTNGPDYNVSKVNMVEWEINSPAAGTYTLYVTYAALASRPVQLVVNEVVVNANACSLPTGGWETSYRKELSQGTVDIVPGRNLIRLYSDQYFPHVNRIRLALT